MQSYTAWRLYDDSIGEFSPGTHMVNGENWLPQVVLWLSCSCHDTRAHVHTYTHTINKSKTLKNKTGFLKHKPHQCVNEGTNHSPHLRNVYLWLMNLIWERKKHQQKSKPYHVPYYNNSKKESWCNPIWWSLKIQMAYTFWIPLTHRSLLREHFVSTLLRTRKKS